MGWGGHVCVCVCVLLESSVGRTWGDHRQADVGHDAEIHEDGTLGVDELVDNVRQLIHGGATVPDATWHQGR